MVYLSILGMFNRCTTAVMTAWVVQNVFLLALSAAAGHGGFVARVLLCRLTGLHLEIERTKSNVDFFAMCL